MTTSTPELVAITVTYNSETVLEDFLASISKQPRGRFRTIIIDNGSSDATPDLLRKLDDTEIEVLLLERNLGVAAANNIGLRRAIELSAKSVLLINNDVIFDAQLYSTMAAWSELEPDAAVAPVIPYYAEPDLVWFAGGQFQWWRGYIGYHLYHKAPIHRLPQEPYLTEYAPTTCLSFPISWIERIGFQDEIYFIYWEDTDYVYRMNKAGMQILVDPRVQLFHKVSVSTGGPSNPTTLRYLYRNHMIFLRKFHGRLAILLALLIIATKAALRLISGSMTVKQSRIAIGSVIEGLKIPLPSGSKK